jgi:hypothetical protein
MARQLSGIYALPIALVVVSLACTGPAEPAPGSPGAQATSVQRTAVARVQSILANKSTPTPQPAATPTPAPTCPNAIWWSEARTHTGETRTIQGTVIATRRAPGGATLVEVGQPYPDPTGLVIVLDSSTAANLDGKTVCVAGRIGLDEGRPTLQVRETSALTVLD